MPLTSNRSNSLMSSCSSRCAFTNLSATTRSLRWDAATDRRSPPYKHRWEVACLSQLPAPWTTARQSPVSTLNPPRTCTAAVLPHCSAVGSSVSLSMRRRSGHGVGAAWEITETIRGATPSTPSINHSTGTSTRGSCGAERRGSHARSGLIEQSSGYRSHADSVQTRRTLRGKLGCST